MSATVDQQAHDWFVAHRAGWLDPVAKTATFFGNTTTVVALAAGIAVALLWSARAARDAVCLMLTVALAWAALFSIKELVGRHRPPQAQFLVSPAHAPGFSFPSGHATLSAALATALVALLASRFPQVRMWLLVLLGALYPLAVGLSRPYLGVHWLTDVLAGWAIGVLVAFGVVWAVRKCFPASGAAAESAPESSLSEEASCQR